MLRKTTDSKKERIVPGIIAIAFVASAITFLLLLNIEKNILSNYEKVPVWIATANIQKSVEINQSNVEEYFEIIEIDKNIIPEYAVEDVHSLVGVQTGIMIPQGTVISEAMFVDKDDYLSGLSNPVVVGCKAEDLYQVGNGILRQGDMVNIYTYNSEFEETYLLWENVLVYQTFDNAGNIIFAEDESVAAMRINLIIEKENTEQFYTELSKGSLRVVKIWN
jgi:hypothetical protein